jgi:Planctomycete cytochrome C
MDRVSYGKRMSSKWAFALVLVAFAALLTACAAPTGAGSTGGQAPSAAQPPAQQASPAAAPKQAAATTAPAATDAPAQTAAPAAAAANQPPAAAPAAAGVSFSKDITPIFQNTCIKCHGGSDGTKGDLSLKTYDDMMKGGKDGQVINPGDASGSLLVKQIQSGKMPKRGQKLPQDQIDLIAKWVTEGAKNN